MDGYHYRWTTISREDFSLVDTADVKALARIISVPFRLISRFHEVDPD